MPEDILQADKRDDTMSKAAFFTKKIYRMIKISIHDLVMG